MQNGGRHRAGETRGYSLLRFMADGGQNRYFSFIQPSSMSGLRMVKVDPETFLVLSKNAPAQQSLGHSYFVDRTWTGERRHVDVFIPLSKLYPPGRI